MFGDILDEYEATLSKKINMLEKHRAIVQTKHNTFEGYTQGDKFYYTKDGIMKSVLIEKVADKIYIGESAIKSIPSPREQHLNMLAEQVIGNINRDYGEVIGRLQTNKVEQIILAEVDKVSDTVGKLTGGISGVVEKVKRHFNECFGTQHSNIKESVPSDFDDVQEAAPAGQEEWIKSVKQDFKDRYGDDWEKVLYATAWKREKAKESKDADLEQIKEKWHKYVGK